MEQWVLIVHVLLALGIIGFVLIQRGKGADAGASFGGASQTVFGSSGSGNFLTRTTAVLAALFFVTSFALAYYAKQRVSDDLGLELPSAQQTLPEAEQALPDLSGEVPSDQQSTALPLVEPAPSNAQALPDVQGPTTTDQPDATAQTEASPQ